MSSPSIHHHHPRRRHVSPLSKQGRRTRYDPPHSVHYRMRSRLESNRSLLSAPTVAIWNNTLIQSGLISQSTLLTNNNLTPPRIRHPIPPRVQNSPRSTIVVPEQVSQPLLYLGADCPICREPLASITNQDIGVTVPCGHCFHWDCYQKWKDISNVCPTCRKCTSDFIRIFIKAEINEACVKDLDKNVVDQLEKCIDENKSLKQEMIELKKELAKFNANANQTLVSSISKIWSLLQNMYFSAKRGCRRPNEDHNNNNNIFSESRSYISFEDSFEDDYSLQSDSPSDSDMTSDSVDIGSIDNDQFGDSNSQMSVPLAFSFEPFVRIPPSPPVLSIDESDTEDHCNERENTNFRRLLEDYNTESYSSIITSNSDQQDEE